MIKRSAGGEAMRPSKPWLARPATVFGVAFGIRLAALTILFAQPASESLQRWFPSELSRIAASIVAGQGYVNPFAIPTGPTALVPPVDAYLLAGIFRIFGIHSMASAISTLALNCLFSALTCVCIYRLASITLNEATAILAAWAWALYPLSIFFALTRLGEASLSPLLAMLLVLGVLEIDRAPALLHWVLLGLTAALAGLTNPALLAIVPLAGLWLAWRMRTRRQKWITQASFSFLVFAACVAPWLWRNYSVFDRFLPFRSNFGLELKLGNGPETEFRERTWIHPTHNPPEREKLARMGEAVYMEECRREAWSFIQVHPGTFVLQTGRRILYTWTGIWSLRPAYLRGRPEDLLDILPFSLLTLFAAAGLWLSFRSENTAAWLYAAAFLAQPLTYYITHVQPRYRHPLEPFLFILAAYALLEYRRRKTS